MRCAEHSSRARQRGTALVTVLLIFALATIVVTSALQQMQHRIDETRWYVGWTEARNDIPLAEQAFYARLHAGRTTTQDGATLLPLSGEFEIALSDRHSIRVEFEDLQGRLNVNNLATQPEFRVVLERYLRQQGAWQSSDPIVDWIDSDDVPLPLGGEDFRYRSAQSPTLAANRRMIATSELDLVMELDDATRRSLGQDWIALPGSTAVNIRSAPADVLSALSDGLSGEQLIAHRETGGDETFASVHNFLLSAYTAGTELSADWLTTESQWYGLTITVHLGDDTYRCYSIVQANPPTGTVWRRLMPPPPERPG